MNRRLLAALIGSAVFGTVACGDDPKGPTGVVPDTLPDEPVVLSVAGQGEVLTRFTAEVWVVGSVAYTTTWGSRNNVPGNALYTWDVSGDTPQLRDSVIVDNAVTLGDVQATADGRYLVVATELAPGSIVVFDLSDPFRPRQVSRFLSPNITRGVHTAEVARVSGRDYAFLAVNSGSNHAARLIIVDLGDPANPQEIFLRDLGRPFIHDVFVRDGLLFTAEWNDGMGIWDIGGGGRGGTPQNPVRLTSIQTAGGQVHNIYVYRDPARASRRYAFIGEEGPASIGNTATGDLHVVDLQGLPNLSEVAAYHLPNAGAHNFTMDESRGLLYAAFYNGGVRVLDVRGNLGGCSADQHMSATDTRCDLEKMGLVRGIGLLDRGKPVYIWGVHFVGSHVYASDMLNGLWKLRGVSR